MTGGLKITAVERITLNVPFRSRVEPWLDLLMWKWRIVEITRVETDAGLVGYGATMPYYTWASVTDEAVDRVRGRNPAEFLADDHLGAGLQMALLDVVGRALETPVYRLFGLPKVRDWCPIAWWTTKAPPDVLAGEAQDAVAEGYLAHKFKARPWFDIFDQVEAIAAATPPSYRLDLDWNGMLVTAGNAKPVLTELDRFDKIAIYESPLPHEDVEGYRQLRSRVRKPIATHFDMPPFAVAQQQEMSDGFVVHNGVSEILRKGALAAAFNKPFWLQIVGPGITTALCAHLGAVLTHAQWPAVTCLNIWADDLITAPLEITGGYLRVPEGPGLGVTIDETALARYRMAPPYDLPEPRHIMSVVWPGGRVAHYTRMAQCWSDFRLGHLPPQERGVTLEVHHDDGSRDWADLYDQASAAPVFDVRQL